MVTRESFLGNKYSLAKDLLVTGIRKMNPTGEIASNG